MRAPSNRATTRSTIWRPPGIVANANRRGGVATHRKRRLHNGPKRGGYDSVRQPDIGEQ